VRRVLVVTLVAAAALAATAGQASARFPWTHRVTISGQFVNHWTVSDPGPCGTNGDGTLTVSFQNKRSIHAVVTRYNYGDRKWLLIGLTLDRFHQSTFLPPQPATAPLTAVDNTSPANQPPWLDSCDPIDKSHCGAKQLRAPKVRVQGQDGSHLQFDLMSSDFRDSTGCQIGTVYRFADVDFFGHRTPQLLIKMPSFRSFMRKRSVTVTGTSHDVKSFPDLDATVTNDVTRTVTVTFTKR
jgi:hypothetical protein